MTAEQHTHRPPAGPQSSGDLFGPPSVERLAKYLKMLSSSVDTEVVVAARHFLDGLRELGRDVHWLGDLVTDHWSDRPVVVDLKKKKQEWQLEAEELLRHPEVLLTKPDEFDFLTNMTRSRFAPTAKQQKWMGDIRARITPQQSQHRGPTS